MKRKRILYLALIAIVCALDLRAQDSSVPDAVTFKDNQVYAMRGDNVEALTESLKFPSDVVVNTDGHFTVAGGKERQLITGEALRSDGWLVEPEGSIQPVFDHVAMINRQVYVVRGGEATVLRDPMVFSNNITINPDGTGANLPAGNLHLVDGQLFRLDGTPIPAMDSVSLINGRVVADRYGAVLPPLSPGQMMGMDDGTKVFGDGTIQKLDGTTVKLHEGQTILINGAVYGR
jgi:hypothetical protein